MMLAMARAVAGVLLAGLRAGHYYAHDTVEDEHGVIAPWYAAQNGQFDLRVRVAAETLLRYPWALPPKSIVPAPEYVFSGAWQIDAEGAIAIPEIRPWDNGDLGQRAAYVLSSLVDYYRYSGRAAVIGPITLLADYLLDSCRTEPEHAWPGLLVSVPNRGAVYGRCAPEGMIQLDIVAEVGLGLLRAYQLTGNERWRDACLHWGRLLAERCDRTPGMPPWNRYANPEVVDWQDHMTGGVAYLLTFFDELIRLGLARPGDGIAEAREAGRAYLRDALLPRWTVDDTWGRNYWDWPDPVQAETTTEFVARYMMAHPDIFPNWKSDVRNILSLFLNRTSVAPESGGDMYSGAWAYPESSGCCGRSLWYAPMQSAPVFAQYAELAGDDWAREIARRSQILATYDVHETGMVEDNIDGGAVVAGGWFKIAHPMALKHVLGTMAWLPEVQGASRENHIMRSSSVVTAVKYEKGRIEYSTFDAVAPAVDVLRLAFVPARVAAGGAVLAERAALDADGYRIERLADGDCVVTIRHDGARAVVVEGDDPQQAIAAAAVVGAAWREGAGAGTRKCDAAGAELVHGFDGNQVRVLGCVAPDGGLADVYLDGVRQLVPIDCWAPAPRPGQVLYSRSGLAPGEHTLRVVVRGAGNPVSAGRWVCVDGVQWSDARGASDCGSGGGPRGAQRMIFGYPGRSDYIDSTGHAWRPATEWVMRCGGLADVVERAWWTERRRMSVLGTDDPELYRYGVHGAEFWVNLTVGPGTYRLRLMFAETRLPGSGAPEAEAKKRAITIAVNGEPLVVDMDLAVRAGGYNRAADLVFEGIEPRHGAIEVRLSNAHGGEAILQALELTASDRPAIR